MRMGDLGAWFRMQQDGWGSRWDWGSDTPKQVWNELSSTKDLYSAGCAIIVILAVVLLVIAALEGVWPGLLLYGAFMVAQSFGSSIMLQSRPRLLVSAVTLVIPIALALSRARWHVRILAAACVVSFGLWFSSHALTIWPFGI